MGYEVPRLPQSDPIKRPKGFILIDEVTHKVLPFREYRILNEDGETFRGVSERTVRLNPISEYLWGFGLMF